MTALEAALTRRARGPTPVTLGMAAAAAPAFGIAVALAPLPALGCAVAICAAAVASVRPDLATLLGVFLLYTNAPTVAYVHYHAPYVASAIVVPLLLATAVLAHVLRGEGLVATRSAVLVAALLAVEVLSTIFSERPEIAGPELTKFAIEGVVLFLLVVNAVRTPSLLRATLWTILLAAAGLSVVTVHQALTGASFRTYGGFGMVDSYFLIGKTDSPRSVGPIGDANYYAQILLVAVPIGIIAAVRERRAALRALAAGTSALVFAAIMATDSRGAFVALVLVLVLMTALRQFRARHICALALAAVVLLALMPSYAQRLATLAGVSTAAGSPVGAADATDESIRGRSTEMRVAAMTFADRPLLGVGPGVAPALFQQYAGRLGDDVHQVEITGAAEGAAPDRAAHNMLLTELAELGLVGSAVFVAIIAVSLRDLLQARRHALRKRAGGLVDATTAVTFALVAYLAAGLFLSLAFERYFWALLGLAAAAVVIERSEGRYGPDGHTADAAIASTAVAVGGILDAMNPGDRQR